MPQPSAPADATTIALLAFVTTIESAGGVTTDSQGHALPVADDEWIDLGDAYLQACKALRQEPKMLDAPHG
jgi:hypothetical protein